MKVYEMLNDEKMEETEQTNENENRFPRFLLRRNPKIYGFDSYDSAIHEEQERRKRTREFVCDYSRNCSSDVIGVAEMSSDDDEANHFADFRYSLAPSVDRERHFHSVAENPPDYWQRLRWSAFCRSSADFDPLRLRDYWLSSSYGRHVIEAEERCSPGMIFLPSAPSPNAMQLIYPSAMLGRRPQTLLRHNEDGGASLPDADGRPLSSAFLCFTPVGAQRLPMPMPRLETV